MPNNQPTEAEIDAEGARWCDEIGLGFFRGGSDLDKAVRAHARYVLEWRGRPEDVEAVRMFVANVRTEWNCVLRDFSGLDEMLAQAIIDRYGPPPSPPQITDADVERCAEAIWPWLRNGLSGCRHLGWSAVSAESNGRLAAYAAASTCIGAFLNPPPPDPIQAALDRAADQVRAAGEMRTDAHEQAFRVVLGERKP